MDYFNDKKLEAFESGKYICSKCGSEMKFENEWGDVLICLNCGHSIEIEKYGFEDDEEYEALFPSAEDVLDVEEDFDDEDDEEEYTELYDEVCGELDDD